MSFDWSDLLPLSNNVLGRKAKRFSFEARQRCAISRVYYGVLMIGRNHLRDKDKIAIPNDSSLHSFVINQFRFSYDKNRKQIGRLLWRLRALRNAADYEDKIVDLAQKTQLALDLANNVLVRLNRL